MNLAHYFTFVRIFLVLLFPVFYLYHQAMGISLVLLPYLLLIILVLCEMSDLIDGIIARKKNQVTEIGKIIDPMADVITHLVIFFTLTKGFVSLPILIIFVFLYREILIGALRTICGLQGLALAARKSGKFKSLLQAIVSFGIVLLMIPYSLGGISLFTFRMLSIFMISIAAVYSFYSCVEYLYFHRAYIKKQFEK